MNEVINSLRDIAKIFEKLLTVNNKYLIKQSITKICSEFSYFFNSFKKILIKQNDLFKDQKKIFLNVLFWKENHIFKFLIEAN